MTSARQLLETLLAGYADGLDPRVMSMRRVATRSQLMYDNFDIVLDHGSWTQRYTTPRAV